MASLLRRTTLADERRALRAQSQQRTAAPRVHEETYDSSSDEEDPEPFHRQQQQQQLDDDDNDDDSPMTTVVSDLKKDNDNKGKDGDKAKLDKLYEEKLKKKARRNKHTLKPQHLIDPETGLGRLLHKQPQLSKPNSTTACAAYTRKLFQHYHVAVREWTAGRHAATTNDTTWMSQVEKLSSQKVVRDHVESLRQVICRQFVEDQIGLEKSDGWFEELMQERQEQMLPLPASPERAPAPSSPVRVSPPQEHSNDADEPPQDEEGLALRDSPRPKRALPATTTPGNSNSSQPPLKRRVVQDDESDDEELEFETSSSAVAPGSAASTSNNKPVSKRRVLDDDDDSDDEEAELEIEKPKEQANKVDEEMKDEENSAVENAEEFSTRENADGAATTNGEETSEAMVEKENDGIVNPSDANAVGPTDGNSETPEANKSEKAIGDENKGANTAPEDATGQEDQTTSNVSSPERSKGSPSANSPYRLQVLEELTQGSSTNVGMNLGQESQPFATQPSQDEKLFDTFISTQESFHLDLPARANTETSTAVEASLPTAEDEAAVSDASPTASPPEEDTIVPSDSSPPEDETVVPSMSETQATLIPSETQETPTQRASASLQSNDD